MLRSPPRPLLTLLLLAPLACRTPGVTGAAEAERAAPAIGGARVIPVALYADPKLGLEVARGELTLPGRFLRPDLRPAPGESGVAQIFLVRAEPAPVEEEVSEEEEEMTEPPPTAPAAPFVEPPVRWKVFALRRGGAAAVALDLRPEPGAAVARLTWRLSESAPGTREELLAWARARLYAQDLFGSGDGPLQAPLLAAAVGAYGLDAHLGDFLDRGRDDGPSMPSLLALLGGRAAVDETLQLDRRLTANRRAATGAGAIPIDRVKGIEVKPHPWAELLAGRRAPHLPLADCVPVDRAMLYLPRPKEAVDGLEHGAAGFLERVSSFAREGRLDYAIIERTLDDLGLGNGLGRKLLSIGAIREAAIFTPDLSLLSGTEVTVVAEVTGLFQPLLPIGDGEVQEKSTPTGKAWRARRGGRVFVSTSRGELDRALALDAAGGAGSLGRSDELAFLLLQLAPTERTHAFAYLSDPFIRRLVGPAQRIARLRLDQARAEMEKLAGAALLRRIDVPGDVPTLASLRALGYLPEEFPETAYRLKPDGRVESPIYGPLERLHPIARLEPATVTAEEAELYGRFRDQYTRYWRRFFDPIAVRFDDRGDGSRELETFILPLLDSSIYRELGRELAHGARPSVAAPRWAFPSTFSASFQLPAEVVKEVATTRHLPGALRHAGGGGLEQLAASISPAIHVAFPDAAPILQVGGGSAFGPAAASVIDGGEPAVGILLAALTRPMVAAVELKDPERARRALERLTSPGDPRGTRRRGDWFDFRLARDDAGRIIVTADFMGLVTLRHTVRIEDRWLVISNDTTLPPRLIDGARELRGAAAAIELTPAALKLGLPAAWQSAIEAESDAAFAARHWLAPWLSGGATVAEAQAASRALLGAAPPIGPDELLPAWNGTFEHRRYGTRSRPLLPSPEAGKDFGLFEGIREARVEASFEGDGLRTRVTWTGARGK
jgi:hypothetical protein